MRTSRTMTRVCVLVVGLVGAGCFTDLGSSVNGASDEGGATGASTGTTAGAATTEPPGTTDAPVTGEAIAATGEATTSVDETSTEVTTSTSEQPTTGGSTTGGSTTTQPSTDPSGPTTDDLVTPCGDDVSLVACYQFEALTDVVLDDSSYANHAKAMNAALTIGAQGMGLDVNKTSVVSALDGVHLSPGDALTYAAWISPRSLPADDVTRMVILDKGDEYAMVLAAGGVRCEFPPMAPQVTAAVKANAWTHVACVHRANGEFRLYIDGMDVGGGMVGAVAESSMAPLVLGNVSSIFSPKGPYDGLIDEVRIWSRSLGEDEIKALAEP